MTPEVIKQSIQLWTNEPEKAKVSPVVKARTEGAQAIIETGPFSWRTDVPPPLGGENKAASPTALLLGRLGTINATSRHLRPPPLGRRASGQVRRLPQPPP
jgi:hypothetical protein